MLMSSRRRMKRCGPSRRLEVEPRKVTLLEAVATRPQSSPEPICVICQDRIQHKSYLNNCLHQFCFVCLQEWSKVKSVCPLCQQKFDYALHNVRSERDYDMHVFSTEDVEDSPLLRIDEVERLPVPETRNETEDRDSYVPTYIIMVDFRRYVYDNRLLSLPVRGNVRNKACTPEYMRLHQQEMRVRLIPWLNRELGVVISIGHGGLPHAIEQVLHFSKQWHLLSSEFRQSVAFCTDGKADLFTWELYNFAASFRSMVQFDDEVRYVVPGGLDVPSHFRQFCAPLGTTNPMVTSVGLSLGLSPTVQSPARSVPSPAAAPTICPSDTDSEDDPNIGLHFRTARHQGRDDVELNSLRCARPSREQVTRPKFSTALGHWSSDTSVYESEDTAVDKVQHKKKKKLGKTKNSKKQRNLIKKLKTPVRSSKKNKGEKHSISEVGRQDTNTFTVSGASSSNTCSYNSRNVGTGQKISSRIRKARDNYREFMHPVNSNIPRHKRICLSPGRSSESDSTDSQAVHGEKYSVCETPISYYHMGLVQMQDQTAETDVGCVVPSASRAGKPSSKKKLSSVIVKPTTNS